MGAIHRVGARELKTRLGHYLNRVRRGDRFIVTDRHEPIAELRAIAVGDSVQARLGRLVASGAITGPVRAALKPFTPVRLLRGRAADAVSQDRDDRT